MNAFENKQLTDDDARFDRLVDGELTADEYKSLVAGLDDEPGGWRRCALAFLEAQALSGELSAIRQSGKLAEQPVTSVAVAPRKAAELARWKLLLAMSASFLVAFILGVTLPSLWQPNLWRLAPDSRLAGPDVPVKPTDPAQAASLPDGLVRTVGNARLVFDGPSGTQTPAGDVPIYELPAAAGSSWLTQHEPTLPEELINELERRGHRVEWRQQYVPVNLEDGREGVIPVESYQITPVSRRAY
jgi:hypothetical protein